MPLPDVPNPAPLETLTLSERNQLQAWLDGGQQGRIAPELEDAWSLAQTPEADLVTKSVALLEPDVTPREPPEPWPVSDELVAAGLAVMAEDTGRVLMLQRALVGNEDDPAAGSWEFPGGHIEEGEDPFLAAVREWQEETGVALPEGDALQQWMAGNRIYTGFVYLVPEETAINIHAERAPDPDGDGLESLAWFDLNHLPANPTIRAEMQADMPVVMECLLSCLPPVMKAALQRPEDPAPEAATPAAASQAAPAAAPAAAADPTAVAPAAPPAPVAPPPPTHTSVMIALVPELPDAARLAEPGGLPPEELHVTLAFLGDQAALSDEQVAAVRGVLDTLTKTGAPIVAGLNGAVVLRSEQQTAYALVVDAPEIEDLHTALLAALLAEDVPVIREHGFLPHMTLAYDAGGPEGTQADVVGMPAGELQFKRVALADGGEWTYYGFGQGQLRDDVVEPVEAPGIVPTDEASGVLKRVFEVAKRVWESGTLTDGEDVRALPEWHELAAVAKRDGVQLTAPIVWKNTMEQIAYGPVLIPGEPDSDGDIVGPEKVAQVAHAWLEKYQNVDHMHDLVNVDAVPVESYITPLEMQVEAYGEQLTIPAGSWILATKIRDPQAWHEVQTGKIRGYSLMGVRAKALPVLEQFRMKRADRAVKAMDEPTATCVATTPVLESDAYVTKRTTLADLGPDWEAPFVSLVDLPAVPMAKFFALKRRGESPASVIDAPLDGADHADKVGRKVSNRTLGTIRDALTALSALEEMAMSERTANLVQLRAARKTAAIAATAATKGLDEEIQAAAAAVDEAAGGMDAATAAAAAVAAQVAEQQAQIDEMNGVLDEVVGAVHEVSEAQAAAVEAPLDGEVPATDLPLDQDLPVPPEGDLEAAAMAPEMAMLREDVAATKRANDELTAQVAELAAFKAATERRLGITVSRSGPGQDGEPEPTSYKRHADESRDLFGRRKTPTTR